jgi:hypothetical protein
MAFAAAKMTGKGSTCLGDSMKSRKVSRKRRLRKKICRQGAQTLRSEAYSGVLRSDEGCRATQQPDFLRSSQSFNGVLNST